MYKWLTRFVLAVAVAMMPVKWIIQDADSVLGRFLLQGDDRVTRTEPICGGWDGRACNDYDEVMSPAARKRVIEEEVARWLDHWGSKAWSPDWRGLKRMGRYEDYIDAELAARNLPPSLRYLPLIEADYDHLAVSPAGAAGLWQLMPETARWLGLEVNAHVDQRFDVYAATGPALEYLVALRDQFQCWFLALAAYNAGPTRIERAIRRHGGTRPRNNVLFWHIRDQLPKETQDFIPRFLATVRVAGDLSVIGQAAAGKDPPERFEVVRIEGPASADVLAEAAGIAEDEIRTLNPHLRIGLVPAGRSTRLRVPVGAEEAFLAHFASIPVGQRSTLREHIVVPGETLVRIARSHDVTVDALRTVNPDVEPRRMQVGTVLVIPRSAGTVVSGIAAKPSDHALPGPGGAAPLKPVAAIALGTVNPLRLPAFSGVQFNENDNNDKRRESP